MIVLCRLILYIVIHRILRRGCRHTHTAIISA